MTNFQVISYDYHYLFHTIKMKYNFTVTYLGGEYARTLKQLAKLKPGLVKVDCTVNTHNAPVNLNFDLFSHSYLHNTALLFQLHVISVNNACSLHNDMLSKERFQV